MIGNLEIDKSFIIKLCNILDLGMKFVPSIFFSHSNFIRFFLNNLDCNLYNFNKFLFYAKQKFLKNKDNLAISTCTQPRNNTFIYYLNKMNKKNKGPDITWQHETLVLRELMIKTLANKPFSKFLNLKLGEIEILYKFLKEKNFIISPCDKNVGFAIMSKELYRDLSFDHLNSKTYKKLNCNPLKNTIEEIKSEMRSLNSNGHVSDTLFKHLEFDKAKLGKLKIMPKIHKSKFGIRPIIASINHPTSLLSFVIDFIFQPLVIKNETYLKDSQNLIQICENKEINKEKSLELGTADFESLYTNLDPSKTIERICDYLNSINFKNEHISLYGIKTFLLIIFNKNVFSYENNFYIQLIGIAMGCKCGPSVANLCLYIQEINWVRLNKPIIYQRFIDDIVYLNKNGLDKNDLINQFDNLKLNFVTAKKVQFLDLNIEIDNLRNKLKFSLYTKPTNTFQYLHKNSNHPKHIFNNIPKSLFIRIRRNCSDDTDYYYNSGILLLQLKERGYDFDFLFKILCQIGRLERENLIKYKEKRSENDQNSLRLCMGYDHNYFDLKKDILLNFQTVCKQYEWLNDFKLNITNSILPNLKKILIENFYFDYNNLFFTKNCKTPNCSICKYTLKCNYLNIGKFKLPLKCKSDCKSCGIVYIIKCTKCNIFYIGESEFSAIKRMSQHLYDISNFVPYGLGNCKIVKINNNHVSLNKRPKRLMKTKNFNIVIFRKEKKISEVAEHFNLKGHCKDLYFKFCIFDKDLQDKNIRQSVETDLMNILKNFGPILNKKIPNFKFVKKLCFS